MSIPWISYKRGLISLVNDIHVDNNFKGILLYLYLGSIVNYRPKNCSTTAIHFHHENLPI